MSARAGIGFGALVVVAVVLVEGMLGLPPAQEQVGEYGQRLAALASSEREAANAVTAVLFDLRVLDTLGEALALFAGTAAVQVVLRERPMEQKLQVPASHAVDRRPAPATDAVRAVSLGLATPVLLYGSYIVVRGHISVGGGFQGGVIIAAAIALIYLAGRQSTMHELAPEHRLDLAESIGIGGFLAIGLVALATGAGLFGNILPLGDEGRLLSAGTIAVFSVLIGLEAAAAIATLVQKFVEQTTEVREEHA